MRLPAFALGTPSADPGRRFPATRESADHSFYYCVAIALLEGDCGEAQFDIEKFTQPALRQALTCSNSSKIRTTRAVAADRRRRSAGSNAGRHDTESRYDYPPGHPRNPLDRAALLQKFHAHTDPVLTHAGADTLRTLRIARGLQSARVLSCSFRPKFITRNRLRRHHD